MARMWDITSDDLGRWAREYAAASLLPKLVRRLLLATSPLHSVEIRADAGVRLGGWDGVVSAREGTGFCPRGLSVWELSTTSPEGLTKKLNDDFKKRTGSPGDGLRTELTTYVAVVAHRYSKKRDWMRARGDEGPWRDVWLYDADDLAMWLERAPAVAAWFADTQLKRPVDGILDVEEYLERWSHRSRPPLPHAVVRAGREPEVDEVQGWLERLPDEHRSVTLTIRGDSREEAVLFVASVLAAQAGTAKPLWLARTMILENREAWRWATRFETAEPLVLLPDFEGFDAGDAATYKGPCLIPLDPGPSRPEALELSLLDPRDVERALMDARFAEPEARRLAQESGGSLRSLQSLCHYEKRPGWVETSQRAPLMAMLLAGAWEPGSEADRQVMGELGSDADAVEELCTRLARGTEPPVEQVESAWRWRSHADAWRQLAGELTRAQLERFVDVVRRVLGALDPRYDMPAEERFFAQVGGRVPAHSPALREGLATSLARLAVSDDALRQTHGRSLGSALATRVVGALLTPAWKRWASLAALLPILAEAAPKAFVDALERSLDEGEEGAAHLLAEEEDALFGRSPHTGLLWALELLGWSRDLVAPVADALARLAAVDPGGRLSNRPSASLLALLHPWAPKSLTSAEERLQILKRIMERQPEVGWRLALDMLKSLRGGVAERYGVRPRFQPWQVPGPDELRSSVEERTTQRAGVLELLIRHANGDASHWAELIPVAFPLDGDAIRRVLDGLDAVRATMVDPDHCIWASLRREIYLLYLRDQDVEGSELGQRIKTLYEALTPEEPVARSAWLFSDYPKLPEKASNDVLSKEERVASRRRHVLHEIGSHSDRWHILERLSHAVEVPGTLGEALSRVRFADEVEAHLLDELDNPAYQSVYPRFFVCRTEERGETWLFDLLRKLVADGHAQHAARIATEADAGVKLWDLVDKIGEPLHSEYWKSVRYIPKEVAATEWKRAIENLLGAGNHEEAIHTARLMFTESTAPLSEEQVDILTRVIEAVRDASLEDHRLVLVNGYEIAQLFEALERAENPDQLRVVKLEIHFLDILDTYGRHPRHLSEVLEDQPELFAELVAAFYKRDDREEPEEPASEEEKDARARRASSAYRILESWDSYPGAALDAEAREAKLLTWARAALAATGEKGCADMGALEVAKVLARAPAAPEDNLWPCHAARQLLEERAHTKLAKFLRTAKRNLHGSYNKSIDEGGQREREMAARHRAAAETMRMRWPRTASLLNDLARSYEADAEREDDSVRGLGMRPRERTREQSVQAGETEAAAATEPARLPEEVRLLERLKIEQIGPASAIDMEFAPRLNVLTGDNSVGKTLVLDTIWWALTGSWPGEPAWPSPTDGLIPSIGIGEQSGGRSHFDVAKGRWSIPNDWPLMQGLVLYARVDGGFSVWDPQRSAISGVHASSLHFIPEEVFYGKAASFGPNASEIRVCDGLIADWTDWVSRKRDVFERFSKVFEGLSPARESMTPGKIEAIRIGESLEYPHIQFSYGDVPVIHLSAAVKRILSLAYMLVWMWYEHREMARRLSKPRATSMVLLIDEVEAHLHPAWQRVFLPALFRVIEALDDALDVQVMASTHAPLVMASLEPDFDEERDALFHFALDDGKVTVDREPWLIHGDASAWLTSPIFGLEEPRSKYAEDVLKRAMDAVRRDPLDVDEMEALTDELSRVFPETDRFWARWLPQLDRARSQT